MIPASHGRRAAWFAVSATWNDEAKGVETATLLALMQDLLGLLAAEDAGTAR